MATPSSSATSPSPPMAYLHQPIATPQSSSSMPVDSLEREHRKKAVQKFLARAEISMVTRALRARLSYASYKAAHNIPHVPLRDLEAQTQTQTQSASFSRTIAAKRKAAGANNYYNNPATQGNSGMGSGAGSLRRGGSGAMAPPVSLTPRSHYYPGGNGSANTASSNINAVNNSRSAAQSLYTSILAPPPAKQARTIHNASDPPLPAPSRPVPSPRARGGKPSARSIAEGTRAQAKSRREDKGSGASTLPDKRKGKRADKGKQKQKRAGVQAPNIDADGDVDMKAAATLTSLLLHHRPSIAGSTSSPRSSIDSSETGSTHSHSQFAQSSARTTTTSAPTSSTASTSTVAESSFRNNTPPPNPNADVQHLTPRPAPTDNEAADLMLFLATSPSPARPSNKDSKDQAAYRALGGVGGALRAKGRVLFPTASAGDVGGEDGNSGRGTGLALARGGESSFTSSISSIGSEMGMRGASAGAITDGPPPRSMLMPTPAQLLPPPPLPLPASTPGSSSTLKKDQNSSVSPKANYQGTVEFNFNDFINASPSPSRGTVGQGQKGNLGLRADVGRKLFEEEQIRHGLGISLGQGKRQEERGLGAGIDLVQS